MLQLHELLALLLQLQLLLLLLTTLLLLRGHETRTSLLVPLHQ